MRRRRRLSYPPRSLAPAWECVLRGSASQAFEKASELPEDLQDQLAQELLEELEWESRWDSIPEGSQDKLERLAEKALKKVQRMIRTIEAIIDEEVKREAPGTHTPVLHFTGMPFPCDSVLARKCER